MQTVEPTDWHAVGCTVVELEYYGNGRYWAEQTTVTRVTPSQIITATGRRFWRERRGLGLVGQSNLRIAGIPYNPVRLVPPDNKHAVKALGEQR